jgi:5-methylthioadenosine/S-adenosylhomocysteine deaminase
MPETVRPARLLTPRWIAPAEPAGTVLHDHAVVLQGDRIQELLPTRLALERHPGAERVDLPDHLLIPGLVNLHSHAAMSLLRGVGEDLPLERWLRERVWPIEAKVMSEEFVYDGSMIACHEMVRGGITTFNDMYFFPEAVARAALAIGMRACVGIILIDFPSAYGTGSADYLRKGLALRDALRHEPTIEFTLAPHSPYTVSDDGLREIAKLSGELQLPIHTHVHETASEVQESLARHGARPLQRLAELGLVGPELIAVHAIHLDESDLQLLASHRASVAHCPHSNLKLGCGVAPTARMRELGIQVGIGTDGSASNNRLDCLAEARSAALLAKGARGDAAAWSAHDTLHAATLAGARALGLGDRIGSIVAGKQADLVAIDLSEVDVVPIHEPVSQLFHAAGREQVSHVWIAGELVVHKRQLTSPQSNQSFREVVARCRLWHNRLGVFVPEAHN